MSQRRRARGEGSIYERPDGRWAATVSLGFRQGKRVRKQLYGATKREVQDKLNRVLTNLQDGLEPPSAKQTLKQFLEHWLECAAKPRLRPRTYIGYEQHLETHVIRALGHLRLHALTPQQVQAMLAGLQLKKLAPRTIRGCEPSFELRWRTPFAGDLWRGTRQRSRTRRESRGLS